MDEITFQFLQHPHCEFLTKFFFFLSSSSPQFTFSSDIKKKYIKKYFGILFLFFIAFRNFSFNLIFFLAFFFSPFPKKQTKNVITYKAMMLQYPTNVIAPYVIFTLFLMFFHIFFLLSSPFSIFKQLDLRNNIHTTSIRASWLLK